MSQIGDEDEPTTTTTGAAEIEPTRNATYTSYSYRRNGKKEIPKRLPYQMIGSHKKQSSHSSSSSLYRRNNHSWSRSELKSNQDDATNKDNHTNIRSFQESTSMNNTIKSDPVVRKSNPYHHYKSNDSSYFTNIQSKKWKRSDDTKISQCDDSPITELKPNHNNALSSMTKTKHRNGLVLKSSQKNKWRETSSCSDPQQYSLIHKKDLVTTTNHPTFKSNTSNYNYTESTSNSWRRTSSKTVNNDNEILPKKKTTAVYTSKIKQSVGRPTGPVIKRIRLNDENELAKVGPIVSENESDPAISSNQYNKNSTGLTDFAYSSKNNKTKMGLVRIKPDKFKTPICKTFARGIPCTNVFCTKRHDVPAEAAMPLCSYFQRNGQCLRIDTCPFRHVKVNPHATDCPSFTLLGFCEDPNCVMKHSRQK